VRLNIRSKLILFTVLPVLAVYSLLFWLGLAHLKNHLTADAQQLLVEHARHQASRLALVFSQVPVLAESLGDLVLAEPEQPQSLLYAHLIDGLRRTPIARTAAVTFGQPPRGASMRRGESSGQPIDASDLVEQRPGWHVNGDALGFIRPIYRQGARIGESWVEFAIEDVYTEIERLRSPNIHLFVDREDGTLLAPGGMTSQMRRLASLIPGDMPIEQVQAVTGPSADDRYWMVNAGMPGLPWRITAVIAREKALAPARGEATLFAGGLFYSLVAILAIISMVARQITRPLATLDASVQQITRGDFGVAPEIASDDELGGLARAIRRMAGHISQREQELRNSHRVLEQRVAQRTAALQQSNAQLTRQIAETRKTEEALRLANEQAQQANRAKTEFLSNMSHELRTPLHGVLGYAQILRRDTATSGSQRESLEAIERCGQHLLTLINDILDLTKIEAGQMKVDILPTDLPRLLDDVHMIMAQRAVAKGLALHLDLAGDLPRGIVTDPVKLKQILLNLLGNAIKFTAQGAVTLSVAVTPQGRLGFEVTDTGVGIPADKVDAIFDAFHQARDGLATDGTGLGLAINQRLIGLLGGDPLTVDSTPGEGSRFRFCIPLQPLAGESLKQLQAGTPKPARRLRLVPDQACTLMVVDEMADNRDVVSALLRYADCGVEAFCNLAEATQRLREKAFDLVLYDVRLLDARAAEAVNELRRHAAFGTPKLVAVSANVFPGVDRSARQAGFDGFLAKPFNEQQLLTVISDLLNVRFETRPEPGDATPPPRPLAWPTELAHNTATRVRDAIELGDVGSLFQLAEELTDNPAAPRADVDNMAMMARMFDFDGLRQLCERLQAGPRTPAA